MLQITEKEFGGLMVGEHCQSTWPRESERAWITPDISGGDACASLAAFRLAG